MQELENERREYRFSKLDETHLAKNPLDQFSNWMKEALDAGIQDPTAMTVSTVNASGQPASRIVLLKGFDETGFRFFTGLDSHKGQDIRANPRVALHFPWLQMDRQVIVKGIASQLDRALVEQYFARRPRESQVAARVATQSTTIASRETLDAAYQQTLREFEGKDIPAPENWGGFAVTPDAFEFWQGGEHRLHDRFVYERDSRDGWKISRLAP
ncbi:MAG: pyridoxamine 5'-phosphate oxidase [Pseudomonadota bacterium]